ncbi:L,D-transpeptidase family protein [Streptomyces evansiae]|uniref:L,D-transpeptidase family protein n=1 Tax=Streptomyces evansiae TaxID=3075535 RepID=UPI00288B0552|nr:L,D-transpeptidase family protein [Streptomyces sp. DSM 41859]
MSPTSRARRVLAVAAAGGALVSVTACGSEETGGGEGPQKVAVEAGGKALDTIASASASATSHKSARTPSPSAPGSASPSPGASAKPSASASAEEGKPVASATGDGGTGRGSTPSGTGTAPRFPVPAQPGDASQLITVRANGSYATVTAWDKGPTGWKAAFSTSAGRVGANGVTNGATRRQNTYTTPSGTYTLTEGFGVEAGGTRMPYHVVSGSDWWVEDPRSAFYNRMHSAVGADFPLTEAGERGSERLADHPTQYAKALVIDYNRRPATPGRGAGIFLHINGAGATAGCVSVPRPTMDRIMTWISPAAHPRIAIG